METFTPTQLVHRHLDEVLDNLDGACDGDVESVHRARIATRRLREVLPLIDVREMDHVTATVRAAGRHLGRVRELDVMSSLLNSMGDHVPIEAATEWHALRQDVRRRLSKSRRKMVKDLEQLDLRALRDLLAPPFAARLTRWVPRPAHVLAPKWVDSLWTRIADRSSDADTAAQRAPAVYFPNRTHNVRIAVKKLRYAVEIADETGVWRPRRVLKDLRRIQGILGDLHDVQVLADRASDSSPSDGAASAGHSVIREILAAEIDRLAADYASRRERIFEIANACRRAASRTRWRVARPLVAVTVLTAPLIIESLARSAGKGGPRRRQTDAERTQAGAVPARLLTAPDSQRRF